MTKKFHIAIEVKDIADSVDDYSKRLGCKPEVVIENEYALWRTDIINFSIKIGTSPAKLRHIGFEDNSASNFSEETDVNGLVWEKFSAEQQKNEINNLWGNADSKVVKLINKC